MDKVKIKFEEFKAWYKKQSKVTKIIVAVPFVIIIGNIIYSIL